MADLFFPPAQKLLDCILFRTPEAASQSLDNNTKAWVAACQAGRPVITTAVNR